MGCGLYHLNSVLSLSGVCWYLQALSLMSSQPNRQELRYTKRVVTRFDVYQKFALTEQTLSTILTCHHFKLSNTGLLHTMMPSYQPLKMLFWRCACPSMLLRWNVQRMQYLDLSILVHYMNISCILSGQVILTYRTSS